MTKDDLKKCLRRAFTAFSIALVALTNLGCSQQDVQSQQITKGEERLTIDAEQKTRLEKWANTPKEELINNLRKELENKLATSLGVTPEEISRRIKYRNDNGTPAIELDKVIYKNPLDIKRPSNEMSWPGGIKDVLYVTTATNLEEVNWWYILSAYRQLGTNDLMPVIDGQGNVREINISQNNSLSNEDIQKLLYDVDDDELRSYFGYNGEIIVKKGNIIVRAPDPSNTDR